MVTNALFHPCIAARKSDMREPHFCIWDHFGLDVDNKDLANHNYIIKFHVHGLRHLCVTLDTIVGRGACRRDACADMVATIQITQCKLRQDSRYENALRVVLQQVAIRIHNHLARSAYVITSSRSSVVINSVSYAHIKKELDRSMLVYAWWPCFV